MVGQVPKAAYFLISLLILLSTRLAQALPAFAFKEQVSCILCHTNNSVPHLTKMGYMYRRAGFRFPTDIGDVEKDTKVMDLIHHLAAGINIDYQFVKNKPPGESENTINNDISVREVEVWPLIGAFYGNYASWSELDMSPNTAADRQTPTAPGVTTPPDGGVSLSQADLRYVAGDAKLFYNMRAGLIAPEGYGASDQWIDDGNLPLIDQLTAYYNEDTLVLPLGAFQSPQLGVEFGVNTPNTYLTLGILNGFDGTSGFASKVQSTANPRRTSSEHDYKIQLDQFFNEQFAVTAVYYSGAISLLDPTNTLVWRDKFQLARLYFTYSMVTSPVDFFFGGAYGSHDYVNSGSAVTQGQFFHKGAFVGANWYVKPYLTLAAHFDHFQYAVDNSPSAKGGALMACLTFEPRSVFVFRYNVTDSDLASGSTMAGMTNDFRTEWRFFF